MLREEIEGEEGNMKVDNLSPVESARAFKHRILSLTLISVVEGDIASTFIALGKCDE